MTEISGYAFNGCSGLTSVNIPKSITKIGDNSASGQFAFGYCTGLTSVTIPSGVTCIGDEAFQGCSSLSTVITEIEDPFAIDNTVFKGIPSSAQLIVPRGKKSAYQSTAGWNQITNIVEVVGIGDVFEANGKYYKIGENNTVSVISGSTKYSGDIVIPSQVTYLGKTYSVMSIGDNAFSVCSGLTSTIIPNSVKSIGSFAFLGCTDLTSITIPNSVESIGVGTFSGCSSLTSITIPNSVTTIGGYAFQNCSSLTSITIPNSVESIGESAFGHCTDLTFVSIGNDVTSIEKQAFVGCTSLASISIPNTVTSIGSEAFYGCTSLTSVTIPSSVTTIGLNAFGNCPDRTSITIENGNMYYDSRNNCDAIIDNNNQLIVGCKNTIIPNSVTSIGNYAFAWCNGLTSMNIPQNVTSIGEGAFERCGLTSINIPNSVTTIGNYAFMSCSSLVYITLSDKLTSIGSSAFSDCYSLSDVYCKAAIVPNAELYSFTHPENIVLHVPFRSLNAYESTEPWSKFKNIVSIYDSYLQASEKCSKPTLNLVDGNIVFSCETPDVSYRWSVSTPNGTSGGGEFITINFVRLPVTLSVYATKSGYQNSDVATYVFPTLVGDVNNDGKVNVADHVKLSDIILNK